MEHICKDCAHRNDGRYTCIACWDNSMFENKYETELAEIKRTAERRNTIITREGLKLDIHHLAAKMGHRVRFEEQLNNSTIICRFYKVGPGHTNSVIINVDLLQAGPNTAQVIINRLLEESVGTVNGVSSADRMSSRRVSYRDYYSGDYDGDTALTVRNNISYIPYGRPRIMRTSLPTITNVIFNDPATIVFWLDGTKTVVKTQEGEKFDPEKGLAMAISKKALSNDGSYCNEFKKWLTVYALDKLGAASKEDKETSL